MYQKSDVRRQKTAKDLSKENPGCIGFSAETANLSLFYCSLIGDGKYRPGAADKVQRRHINCPLPSVFCPLKRAYSSVLVRAHA